VLNANWPDDRMPTATDLLHLETLLVDVPAGDGPFGAKRVGEPPVVSPVAAVPNAVSAAIGIRMIEVPITPERIWRARNEKGK
jgi:xanthine dehydrogenase molybdenum-binding subunit